MKLRASALVALLSLTAACGGDATGGASSDELTPSQRAALAASMMSLGSGAASSGASRDEGVNHDSQVSFTYTATHSCQPSGSVGVAGAMNASYVDATRAGAINATLTVVHASCAHPTQDGAPVVVTGDPSIVIALQAASTAGQVTGLTIRETGAFTWTRGAEASGRCTIDITGTRNAASGKVEFTGSFCGQPVQGVAD